ncbi:MAG: tRNA (adenosine(37)-N6)-dimethylallyltransferase MiaA [Deltaproteobacteria bacterium]|jgi:tRNA dimethylallyltransferase|nr:tRNA (adenosine(37)-N6)-dimethylallyltransferase MiaA [Deltaproteobacteria bacterium]
MTGGGTGPARPRLVVVTGPTGTGKSELAVLAAEELGAEIVNCDSLAFYRHLDIGTAKPGPSDRARVPHHLLDILDPDEDFSAADFLRLARPLIAEIISRGKIPLVAGGTGLYLRSLTGGLFEGPGRDQRYRDELMESFARGTDPHALLTGLDPLAAARIKPSDTVRIVRALEVLKLTGRSIVALQQAHALADRPYETLVLVMDRPPEETEARLRLRTGAMLANGLVEETKSLLARGYGPRLKPLRSVGYRECLEYLDGRLTLAEARERIFIRTRQLAKRQRTWFRGQAPEARWTPPDPAVVMPLIREFLGAGAPGV